MLKGQLRIRFLIPMALMLILLLTALLYFIQRQLAADVDNSLNNDLAQISQLLKSETAEDTETMKLLIQNITQNEQLKTAMRKHNRQALYTISRPILEHLRASYSIDHLDFLMPEHIALPHAHQPERFGRIINRYSAKHPAQMGKAAASIGFGPLGTLALRVVMPWFDGGKLLGYVELTRNFVHLLDNPLKSMHTFIALYKKNLVREKWEAGMRLEGLTPDWNRFPDMVLASRASEEDMKAMSGFLNETNHDHSRFSHEVALGKRLYRTGIIPLFDTSGRDIGDLVVLSDITARMQVFHKEFREILLLSALFSIVLLLFSYLVLDRVEKRLERLQLERLNESLKREALQKQHVKALQATLQETERAEEAALNMMEDTEFARQELQQSFVETIGTLMRAAEYRDDETGAHVKRISYYTKVLAEHMGMDSDYCEMIFYASPMHDIGKIGIPDHILLKAGAFTAAEWEIMKSHARLGAEILSANASPYLQMGQEIALGHHERWDGGGYPNGIKGEAIPLAARIMQLADVYDALRSRRPYKEPFTHEKTMDIICKGDGRTNPSHFDPAILSAFEQCADQLADIFSRSSEPDAA